MILSLVFVAALSSAQPVDVRAEAERQARSGAHAAALKTFQSLAAADPGDLDARRWIGRWRDDRRKLTTASRNIVQRF